MMQLQLNTNGFEKTKAGWPFLFFGQIGSSLIQRASQLFILAVVRCAFLIGLQPYRIGTSLNTF